MVDEPTNVTSAAEWKKDSTNKAQLKELKVPSGKTALVRAPGLEAFMQMGFIPNSLMSVIKTMLDKNSSKKLTPAAEKKLQDELWQTIISDPTKLQDMFGLVDRCVVYCVNQPAVTAAPVAVKTVINSEGVEVVEQYIVGYGEVGYDLEGNEVARDEDVLYVDDVIQEDRMFIFNFACGGTRDYEQFRDERATVMGDTKGRKAVERPTKRTTKPGSKRTPR